MNYSLSVIPGLFVHLPFYHFWAGNSLLYFSKLGNWCLKDFKEICLFCFRKYQTKYFDGISKEFHFKFYNLKKQDEKCFCSIADHDSELFQQICHKWNEETVNSIENSLKEIFSPSTGYRENEITQALKEVIKKSIEQTFESILQAHQKAVEIYEKYEDSDYDISEVKELLEQKFKE